MLFAGEDWDQLPMNLVKQRTPKTRRAKFYGDCVDPTVIAPGPIGFILNLAVKDVLISGHRHGPQLVNVLMGKIG